MATTKPDLTRVWAASAPGSNVVDPDTTTPGKVAAGWSAEVPPFEHFNFLQQWFTQGLAHANEQGFMVWDALTTYPVDGIAKGSDGVAYLAVTEQAGNDPTADDGTNWTLYDTATPIADVATIKTLPIISGQIIETKGYYTAGDGGGASYLIQTAGEFGGTPDEYGDHTLANGNVAVLQHNGRINISQYGVIGDGITNTTTAIKAALDNTNIGVYDFNEDESYVLNTMQITRSNVRLNGNGCNLIASGDLTGVQWSLIFGLKTPSSDGVLRPFSWEPLENIHIDGFIIDYALSLDTSQTPFNMIQLNEAYNCTIKNCVLLNNYTTVGDTGRGNGIVYRGLSKSCCTENNRIQIIRSHCVGHTNKYLVGDFTEAAGTSGTDTYTSNSEIRGTDRPADMIYQGNWCSDTQVGMAFDVHSYRGTSHLLNNYVYNCNQFFKNQLGHTHVEGNYVLRSGDPATYLCWNGWSSDYIEGTFYPDERASILNNIFRNCDGLVLIDHPSIVSGNHFINDGTNEITTHRIQVNQAQINAKCEIVNNRFEEKVSSSVSSYIDIDATSPTIQGATTISDNVFELFSQQATAAQFRIVDCHSASPVTICGNSVVEKNAAADSRLVFAICEQSDLFKVSDNTAVKASSQLLTVAWNAGTSTGTMVTSNIAIGGNINGTFDVNANNLLV